MNNADMKWYFICMLVILGLFAATFAAVEIAQHIIDTEQAVLAERAHWQREIRALELQWAEEAGRILATCQK